MRALSFVIGSLPAVAFAHPGSPHAHGGGGLLFLLGLAGVAAAMRWAAMRWT